MKPKIVVIGSSNMDMIVKVPHIPAPGETVLGNDYFTVLGGKGANQAVAAARAGADVTFISCVGNDTFGGEAVKAYQIEGINTQHIKVTSKAPTGVALINVADSGENSISVAPGANGLLLPEDVQKLEEVISDASILLLQLEIPLSTIKEATSLAKKNNVPVILNPAPAQKLDGELLKNITFLTPNEHEAKLLAGMEDQYESIETLAAQMQTMGVTTPVVTLGANGAFYLDNEDNNFVEGIKVKPVDTTAAGDTFNGYLAFGLAKGLTLTEAIATANKAAAISVTRLGAQPSIPRMKEIESS